jgi:membrane protease subunit HflC
VIVDAFARYRVIDPLKYYQTVGASGADAQLAILLNAALRRVLGAATLTDVVRDKPRCLISDCTLMSGLGSKCERS